MAGKLLIDAHYSDETRIAIIGEDGKLENFEAEYADKKPIKGNIYLAKVVRIEPSIQAAFIDYGGEKNGFLPLSEIHYDYFNQNVLKSLENEGALENSENVEENKESNAEDKHPHRRQIKIQEVISNKQIILVQAEKEVRGNKCAFFTTFISLPGRYCVLVPNPPKGKGNAISKKIEHSEKERLKGVMDNLDIPEGMNVIIRTAGEKRTKQEIKRDFEYLCRLWSEIRDKVTSSTAPALIHEEGDIVKRAIRDLYKRTMDKIIVQGKEAYKISRTFMKTFTPSHVKKIELYDDSDAPLFHKYQIEDKIDKILEPTVTLPSGGTIVINTTEALTAIDVNSGKSKHERDIEETAFKTNLEAASEIARQIKLRDIAGIIVIDFIDMIDYKSQMKVEKAMRDAMKDDYSSIQFGKLSQFGLMEISRQRLRTSLADATFIQCNHCSGSGKILANDTVALSVIRKIENFLVPKTAKSIVVEVAPGIDLFILNHKRNLLSEMEQTYEASIEVTRNASLSAMDCKFIVKEFKTEEILNQTITKKKTTKDVSEDDSRQKEKTPQKKQEKRRQPKLKEPAEQTSIAKSETTDKIDETKQKKRGPREAKTKEAVPQNTETRIAKPKQIQHDAENISERKPTNRRKRYKHKRPQNKNTNTEATNKSAQQASESPANANVNEKKGWLKKLFT